MSKKVKKSANKSKKERIAELELKFDLLLLTLLEGDDPLAYRMGELAHKLDKIKMA
ncbi:MAG: hypothetical protein HQL72_08405 [Magnetococcales bacterium]|nr:hypothetical protein [Magnetococcales bacterium]